MRKIRYLVVALAMVALLLAGAGITSAAVQFGSMMSSGAMDVRDGGMGSMMSMMDDENDMGSMMNGGGMMGSFDEDRPFDLQFVDQMTMHHEGAIMSSEHMISDSKRPELRELAENIEENQSEQIDRMQEWRDEWYPDAEQTSGMPAGMMDEMMGDGMMERMMGGSMQEMMGGATDEMFLRMMMPHHEMAVDMSEKALEEAEHPELKDLARKIIDEQTAEIELMEGYLKEIEAAAEKG
ncbi:MAG: DUF305 domain-containing protein [Actinomycetota bacterium]|nr:DUF305 domain-containing protein [Actinomycetota bacterium]